MNIATPAVTAPNTPTLKRRRVHSEASYRQDQPLTRGLWDPEGDIVIRAETTLFLVNSSRFTVISRVFKDMMSLPRLPEHLLEGVDDLIDGRYPCVCTWGDSPEEWEHVVRIVYDPLK